MDRTPTWAAENLTSRNISAQSNSRARTGADAAVETRRRKSEAPVFVRADGAPLTLADGVASLHAGDALRRAVVARLAGGEATALQPAQRAWMVPHLLITLGDAWPSVRFQAWRSLRNLAEELRKAGIVEGWSDALASFDPQGHREQRRAAQDALFAAWAKADKRALPAAPDTMALDSAFMPRLELLRPLLLRQAQRIIDIGE